MKKSSIIFGSQSELKAFEAIDKHLPEGCRLYANTPLAHIVEIHKDELNEREWNLSLKAWAQAREAHLHLSQAVSEAIG